MKLNWTRLAEFAHDMFGAILTLGTMLIVFGAVYMGFAP